MISPLYLQVKTLVRFIIPPVLLIVLLANTNCIAQVPGINDSLTEKFGYRYKHVVLQSDSSAAGIPLVIALHWSGSSPGEFAPYIMGFDKPVRIVLVQGNYPHRNGFSFFRRQPHDYYKLPANEKMAELLKEGERLSAFIDSVTMYYKPLKKPVIIGASQGGDLSYVIGIKYNHLISQACPLLATIDNRIIGPLLKKDKIAAIDAFHGSADPVVPVDTARSHIRALKKNKFKARLHIYKDIKHDIPDAMKTDYLELINKVLGY